jgi:plastocyanin
MMGCVRVAVLAGAALLCLFLVGCGAPAPNEVDMGVASFQQNAVTIKAGEVVHFVDAATGGGVHALCIGSGLTCEPQSGAPAILNTTQSLLFNQGDIRDIVFPQHGVYHVVCTIHPAMEVVITVQ